MSQTPQNNFYLWQNNDWLNDPANQIPADYSYWGSFVKLQDTSLKNQISILTDLTNKLSQKEELTSDEKKLAIIYQKTMQKYTDWDNLIGNYNELANELNTLDKTLTFNKENFVQSLANYGSYCVKTGINFVLEFDKGSDMQNVENVILDIAPCHISLPTREYYLEENFQKQRNFYMSHLNNVSEILRKNGIVLSENFATNVFEFEKHIAYIKMTNSQSRLYDEYYTKTNLVDVYDKVESHRFVLKKLDNYNQNERAISLSQEEKEKAKLFMETMYEKLELRKYMEENYAKNYSENPCDELDLTSRCVSAEMLNLRHDRIDKELTIYDGDYFVRLFKYLFNEKNNHLCFSWLQYNVIKSMSEYSTKELNDEFFDFYSRKLNDQKEQKPHDKRAVGNVNSWVGELLGKIYVGKYFTLDSKTDIIRMIDKVLEMMRESLVSNDWLTSETKENALLKLSSFKKKIGFPDVWKNYDLLQFDESNTLFEIRNKVKQFYYRTEFLDKINTILDKNKWLMTPQTVNAYLNPQLNEIVFPAAIFQPPFYQSTYESIDMVVEPKEFYEQLGFDPLVPINHGGIIAVIAHEITHGYDDQGRKFDHKGNMVDWWTNEDIKLFTEKTQNMIKQTDLYIYTDSENKIHKMDSQLTMGENLADLGGLTLALKALLSNDTHNHPEAIKLFFRSWANVWKSNYKEQLKIQRLVSDPHAPADFRGNLVKNIDLFHQVFNVKEGDEMWLDYEDRVRMW
jgi:predicted metalloendopeptidase